MICLSTKVPTPAVAPSALLRRQRGKGYSVSGIQLKLLGHFQLQRGDEAAIIIVQGRMQALLAYLALHREAPQARQRLSFLFWPDSSESQARANLRRILYEVRLALPDSEKYLTVHHHWLQWRVDGALMIDVSDFEQQVARAE